MNLIILSLLINILFMYNYLFLNDEFLIFISLLIVFIFLFYMLRKNVLYIFFFIIDNIYYYFFTLLFINFNINLYILDYISYIKLSIRYIVVSSFLTIINIICIKKIINFNTSKYMKKINEIFLFFSYISKIILVLGKLILLKKSVNLLKGNILNLLKPSIYFLTAKNNEKEYINYVS